MRTTFWQLTIDKKPYGRMYFNFGEVMQAHKRMSQCINGVGVRKVGE